jgi:hypothetical protein
VSDTSDVAWLTGGYDSHAAELHLSCRNQQKSYNNIPSSYESTWGEILRRKSYN